MRIESTIYIIKEIESQKENSPRNSSQIKEGKSKKLII